MKLDRVLLLTMIFFLMVHCVIQVIQITEIDEIKQEVQILGGYVIHD